MRGGALPPALLAAALGFALGFAPRRVVVPALAMFFTSAVVVSFWRPDPAWVDVVFYACWASVLVTALAVHIPKESSKAIAIVLAANGGLWAGAVIGAAGAPLDFAFALPWVLICLPARWLASRRLSIAVKVAASWLIAVAVLAASLPATTPTPGYMGDHME